MTGRTPRKQIDADVWKGRLDAAEAFLLAAEQLVEAATEGQNCSPACSNIALSAIAFCDAVTGRRALAVNQKDHSTAPKLLREVLGRKLPAAQERRLKHILDRKDEAQYGARRVSAKDARLLLLELQQFATWCRDELD